MSYTAAELARLVGGTLTGDGSSVVRRALPVEQATSDSITFISSKKNLPRLKGCLAAVVVLPTALAPASIPSIAVEDPTAAILKIAAALEGAPPTAKSGVDPRAAVDPTVVLGEGCSVGPFAVLEAGVQLGKRCVIHPHAVIRAGSTLGDEAVVHPHAVLYPGTKLGDRTIIHSGVVLGCDGFGYQFKTGVHQKVPQLGAVTVGADVEIGANSTVDRAMLGTTSIGDGTKIDNLVMIGHNCQIGKHNILVSHVGVAGSCTTGDYVMMAGKAGIADHIHIGAKAVVGAYAGVHTDIPEGEVYLGTPARPQREFKRWHLTIEKLPELRKQVAEIRRRLGLGRSDFSASSGDEDAPRAAG